MATYPTVELYVNSAWTDITTYVRYKDMISISRGRSSEASQLDTSSCSFTLDNRDGRFSPRNPSGAYYGQIGRNTPVRVSVDGGLPYLNLPGGAGDKSSTPDHASLDIVGDIDVRVEMFLLDWDTTADTEVMGKYTATGNQRSWRLTVDTGGYPKLTWSTDGSALTSSTSTTSIATNGRSRMAIRATLDVNDGAGNHVVTFYTADDIDGTWTQLGNTVTTAGVTSIFSSTATLEIGDISNSSTTAMTGRVYKAEVRDGIGGTEVANPDFTAQTVGASSFVDAAGRTWTQAANASISNRKIRFTGEVSSWDVDWDITGTDVVTKIDASGIIRRLTQGASPLRSPAFREFTNPERLNIVAYWPLEEPTGADSFASGIAGYPVMTYSGRPTLSTSSVWPGSEALPAIGEAVLTGAVPVYTATGETAFRLLLAVPSAGVTTQGVLFSLTGTGTAKRWDVQISTSGGLKVLAYDEDGVELLGNSFVAFDVNGELRNTLLELTQDGADIDWRLLLADYTDIVDIDQTVSQGQTSGTLAGRTVGRITSVRIGETGGNLSTTAIGHVTLADDLGAYSSTGDALIGRRGENPTTRLRRLLEDEEAIALQVHSKALLGNTVTMGVQDAEELVNLVREVDVTDAGIIYEPRDEIAIAYRSRLSLYNQTAKLTLDYAQNELSSPPIPVDDDRYTRNDVTVTRERGSFSRASLDSGALSTLSPPNGVGRYEENVTISLGSDAQLPSQANWRLHVGTVDEGRYPKIEMNLRHSTFTSSTTMMENALELEVGDRVVIENPPSWVPPEDISLIAVGFTEKLGVLERDIVVNCIPESVYHIAELDDATYAGLDSETSTVTSDITSGATSMSVTSTGQPWADSATYASDFPFDVMVGGERMTVTAITGTSSPQTFTVTRSVNGIVKAQTAGTSVRLFTPVYIAL